VLATCLNYVLGKTYIYYTHDFFNTMTLLDTVTNSNNKIFFKDASTGWLGGSNLPDSSIFKFNGVLTSTGSTPGETVHIKISPNPSNCNARLTLPLTVLNDSKTVKVFTVSGRLMGDFSIPPKVNHIALNASDYPDGVYIIQVSSDSRPVMNARWMIMH